MSWNWSDWHQPYADPNSRLSRRLRIVQEQIRNTLDRCPTSLGSQQANRHVHWHVAPLPPGVAFEAQQLAALNLSRGVLSIPAEQMVQLAQQIGACLSQDGNQ